MADYPEAKEAGGLSGPPLMEMSTQMLADMYKLTGGECGGPAMRHCGASCCVRHWLAEHGLNTQHVGVLSMQTEKGTASCKATYRDMIPIIGSGCGPVCV